MPKTKVMVPFEVFLCVRVFFPLFFNKISQGGKQCRVQNFLTIRVGSMIKTSSIKEREGFKYKNF